MSTFFTKDHEYAKVAGATVTCGITDFAQAALGDVVFVSLPEVGTVVKKGCVCCMCAKGAGAWARWPARALRRGGQLDIVSARVRRWRCARVALRTPARALSTGAVRVLRYACAPASFNTRCTCHPR